MPNILGDSPDLEPNTQSIGLTGTILSPPSVEEAAEAMYVRVGIDKLLDRLSAIQSDLEHDFVDLGNYLNVIRSKQYWIGWGFKNFSAYLASVESKVQRGRTQLYGCLGVARDLLPVMSGDTLTRIGISKAGVLRTMVKGGQTPSPELIEIALHGTRDELEAAVAEALGLQPEEDGTWFSYGGARLSDAQKEEFLRTMNVVVRAAGVKLDYAITSWADVPSPTKREIFACLCAEFLSGYEAEVAGEPGQG